MDRDDRDRARARARDAPVDDAEPPDAYGGETWAAFLREAGVDAAHTDHSAHTAHTAAGPPSAMALPSSSASSAPSAPSAPADASSSSTSTSTSTSTSSVERKRRLAAAHSPTRRPSSVRAPSSSQPGSNANPIVLDASPAPRDRPLPPPPSYSAPSQPPRPFRRESDLVLPPWQPDTDVTRCPVCSRHFTFLFRKHHCRKCGRVVCSQCSPHRITIPRQFIVHPPNDVAHNIIDLTGDHDNNPLSNFGPFRNPALGGGEEVRVCNPCVPDPNYSLPPQYPSRDAFRNRRVSHHDASRSGDRWPSPLTSPLPNPAHVYPSHSRQHERSSSSSHPPTGPSYTPQPNQHRAGPESGSARAAHMLPRPFFIPSAQPPSIQQLNPRPRRQIAEEDECPVCGGELPAKGPDGDDTARAQHVEECIALHSSSPAPSSTPRPQAQTSASLPVTRTRGMSSAGNGQGASSYRHSHAARGMFPYIATEKDCVDEDGQDAECVICFEEFQPGDKMARLVCWCKFHEKCIKDWWKMKGRGACPTHQLHEE